MKKFSLIVLALVAIIELNAQTIPGLDPSPADYAYFRPNGPKTEPVIARIIYGRPAKKGRTIIGGVEPFGKVWRLGANEATEIKLYRDVTFDKTLVKAGTYTMYAIPNEKEWTFIINTKLDTWGAQTYEESKDVVRFTVPVGKSEKEVENFTMTWVGKDADAMLVVAWENTMIKIPVKY